MPMGIPKKWQYPILRNVWKYVYLKKGNIVIGITGQPNTGKSWTGNKICSFVLGSRYGVKDYLCFDVESVIRKTFAYVKYMGEPITLEMIYKIKNVDEWLEKNKEHIEFRPGRAILFDEAGVGAYVREFFSKDNKVLSKLLQIWRFLEMVVVVVVPGDMSLADKTISRFLNMEIVMVSVNIPDGYAKAIAYEHIGWNRKKKEPIRRRIKGCKHGGMIKINAMSEERAKEYNDAMFHSKLGSMMRLAREYKVRKEIGIGKTRSIDDDVNYVKEHVDEFRSDVKQGGVLNADKIRRRFGLSVIKARDIKAVAEEQLAKEDKARTDEQLVRVFDTHDQVA